MRSFGLAVSPDFRRGALRKASPRALQVWIVLASMTAHVECRREISGRVLRVNPGDLLIAMRTMQKEVGCGSTQLLAALRELSEMGAIERSSIDREAFPNQERIRSQNESAAKTLIFRINVKGLKTLRGSGGVPESRTQVRAVQPTATSSPLSPAEREWLDEDRQLAAEGR